MVRPTDHKIEQCLQRIVRQSADQEGLTVRYVRERAEKELKLEEGFLKNDASWKQKSRDVISAAFQAEEGPEPAETTPPSPSAKQKSASTRVTTGTDAAAPLTNDVGDTKKKAQTPTKKANATPLPVNGVKRKPEAQETSESGSTSASEEESEAEVPGDEPQRKKAKRNSAESDTKPSESESEESDEGSDTSSEDSEGGDEEVQRLPQDTSGARETTSPQQGLQAISPKPYRVPPGYTTLPQTMIEDGPAMSFDGVAGQQVWHITAPADVPLSSVTEVALDAIQSGGPILTHDGIDYILAEDDSAKQDVSTLLIPSSGGFTPAPPVVSRTLHIRQKIVLPRITALQASQVTGSAAAANVAEAAVSHVRPQPKGLRMRYKPPGFGSGKPGKIGLGSESDDEEEDTRPEIQFPGKLGGHGASEPMEVENVAASSKKAKKKQKHKESVGATPQDVDMANGSTSKPGAEDEKSRRKEQKRARKETKRKGD